MITPEAATVVVRIDAGRLRAVRESGVFAFRGIPFAAPPVGRRAFCAPEPPEPWNGVRDVTKPGAVVPQDVLPGPYGEAFAPVHPQGDDCLNLNVWTPDPATRGLPVLFWIHGGAFRVGSGSDPLYDGAAFARAGIVTVTINYRLGAQGFLHVAEDVEGSGNFGILDQMAALEWVQANVAAFGGDPDRVTIAGQSAGAMSVGVLLAAPRARGLFRRAIAQSGAAHNAISAATGARIASLLADELGIPAGSPAALRGVAPMRIRAAEQALAIELLATRDRDRFGEVATSGAPMLWQPTFGTETLPIRPLDEIRAGSARGIDLLVGTTAEEFRPFLLLQPEAVGIRGGRDADLDSSVAASFLPAGRSPRAALAVYRRNRPRGKDLEVLAAIATDRAFRIPAVRLAEAQSAHAPVRMYVFSWRSPAHGGRMGAGHGVELPFTSGNLECAQSRWLAGGNPPADVMKHAHGAWVRFVESGDPSEPKLFAWPRYDLARRPTMLLDLESAFVDDPSGDERKLWDATT